MGYKKQVFRSLAMVTQLGISVMTPIFLCIFAGCWVDNHFGTKTVLLFLFLGVLAGGRCGYHMAKITFLAGEKDDRKEKEEQSKNRKGPAYEPISRPKPESRVRKVSKTEQAAAQKGNHVSVQTNEETGAKESHDQ